MKNRFLLLFLLIGIISAFYLLPSSGGRLVYEKKGKIFSSTLDGKNTIDLTSSLGVYPRTPEYHRYAQARTHDILTVDNGRKFFFAKNNKAYVANADGKDLKEVPSSIFSKTSEQDSPFFIGTNSDGSKLLFYRVNQNKVNIDSYCINYILTCSDFYLYDFKTNQLKLLDPSEIYKKNRIYIFSDFVDFTKDGAIFMGYDRDNPQVDEKSKGYIYKLDLKTGNFTKISNAAFSRISTSEGIFINPKNKTLLYQQNFYVGDNNGRFELNSFNYETGQKLDTYLVSYEKHWLHISSNFNYLIYGIRDSQQLLQNSFYEYNLITKEQRYLFKSDSTEAVLINNNIIYGNFDFIKGKTGSFYNLYKYNKTLNKTEKILEKVDFLYNWIN